MNYKVNRFSLQLSSIQNLYNNREMTLPEQDSLCIMIQPPTPQSPKNVRQVLKDYELKLTTDHQKLDIYFTINRIYIQNLMQRKQRPNIPAQLRSYLGNSCIIFKEFIIDEKQARIFCGEEQVIKGNIHVLFNPMANVEFKVYFDRNVKNANDYIWITFHHSVAGQWKSKCFPLVQEGRKFCYKATLDEVNDYLQPNLLINISLKKKETSNTSQLGLINLGNTCFMNSCLQMMFYMRPLRKIVLESKSNNQLIKALRTVFIMLMDVEQKRPVDVEQLLQSYAKYNESPRRQQDVQQFLLDFINEIQQQCPQVRTLWEGKCSQTTYSKQKQKPYKSTQVEEFAQLDVHLFNRKDEIYYQKIEDSLKELMEEQQVDEMIENDEFGKIKVAKYRTFETLPDILFVNLKRYEWNKEKMRLSKIFSHIEYQDNLNLGFINGTPGNDQINPECDYYLFSVLVHKGTSPHNGHYFVFVNTSQNCKQPQWVCFNDSLVTKAEPEEVLGFTGKRKREIVLDKTVGKFLQKEIESDASSYLLVYIRRAVFEQYQSISTPIPRDYIKDKIRKAAQKEKESLQQVNILSFDNCQQENAQLFNPDQEYMQIPFAKNQSIRQELNKISKSILGIQAKYIFRVYKNQRKVKFVYPYETALDITKYRRGHLDPSYVLVLSDKVKIIPDDPMSKEELGILQISKNQLKEVEIPTFSLIDKETLLKFELAIEEKGGRLQYLNSKEDFFEGWNRFLEVEILKTQ